MKIAILSDIHGNLRALEAVLDDLQRQRPDQVAHGGDLAINGPRPAEVIDRIRALGYPGVAGNTDEVVWAGAGHAPAGVRVQFERLGRTTADMIGPERVAWLRQLPRAWRHEHLLLVHATPPSLWQAPSPDAPDDDLVQAYGGHSAGVVVYGHVHRPFVRQIGQLTIANSGSVGWPLDGDPRPSYLLVEDGRVSVRRVAYDVEQQIAELAASTYPSRSWLIEVHRRATSPGPLSLDPDE